MENKRRTQLGRASKWRSCDGDTTDRLSYLPDFILYHILSFVGTTKTVVQTSVLSRRWRCVWKHVPALVFDSDSFYGSRKRFGMFVNKVLSLLYPTNVDKITYSNEVFDKYPDEVEPDERVLREYDDLLVVKIIEYAVSHETQHLVLRLSYFDIQECYRFPRSFRSFSNCNLKSLILDCFVIDDRFSSFGFRLLTTLELIACVFESNRRQCVNPFSKFPCLKNLSIVGFDNNNFRGKATRLRIAGLQLHSLKLRDMDLAEVEICAPNLKSFIFDETFTCLRFSELVFPSLDHAVIDNNPNDDDDDDDDDDDRTTTKENVVLLLQAFHNVKSLTLGRKVVKALCQDIEFLDQQPSPFTRLEIVKFKPWINCNYIPYKLASYFLKASSCPSPNIKIW